MVAEDSMNGSLVEPDLRERLVERVVLHFRSTNGRGWLIRVLEVRPLVENYRVAADAALEEQILQIALAAAEANDTEIKQCAEALSEIVFTFVERAAGRETQPVDGQVVYVHEDTIRTPEAVFELEKESPFGGIQPAVQVQVE